MFEEWAQLIMRSRSSDETEDLRVTIFYSRASQHGVEVIMALKLP